MVWALSLCVLAAGMPVAHASHPTTMCLDLTPDAASPRAMADEVAPLVAYPGTTDADHPPQHEGCVTGQQSSGQDWGGTNVDFEITGPRDPDESDSPRTPDMTCTIPPGADHCEVTPPRSDRAEVYRAWIDLDLTDSTVEADLAEESDEGAVPGNSPEPDATDVAQWEWVWCADTFGGNPSCVEHGGDITIAFRRTGVFHGRVINDDFPPCVRERSIKLFKLRDGDKRLKGATTTDFDGRWRITGFKGARGRYRAIARGHITQDEGQRCYRLRSPVLRLP